ncbi:hypothetical protein A0O30_03145 [Pseudomonas sp. LLC-1]|nr:hypothetical protein A0O30_03145 [Pseudomonas sp. LLC-1]
MLKETFFIKVRFNYVRNTAITRFLEHIDPNIRSRNNPIFNGGTKLINEHLTMCFYDKLYMPMAISY